MKKRFASARGNVSAILATLTEGASTLRGFKNKRLRTLVKEPRWGPGGKYSPCTDRTPSLRKEKERKKLRGNSSFVNWRVVRAGGQSRGQPGQLLRALSGYNRLELTVRSLPLGSMGFADDAASTVSDWPCGSHISSRDTSTG